MKIYFITAILFFMAPALNAQMGNAEKMAHKISLKIKDSLQLTESQRVQLYNVNMQLHREKLEIRRQYDQIDSVEVYIQRVEGGRDSLYRNVLNEQKYQLYLQKKPSLVGVN